MKQQQQGAAVADADTDACIDGDSFGDLPDLWPAIARVLVAERMLQGLTTIELARRSGVDVTTVRRVLRGRAVQLGTLRLIVASLDLSWITLLRRAFIAAEIADDQGLGSPWGAVANGSRRTSHVGRSR